MSNLFYGKTIFNDDISSWDISNVTNMSNMFSNTDALSEDNKCIIHGSF